MITSCEKTKLCILFVEDDEGVRQLLLDFFMGDFTVIGAENGLQALKKLGRNTVDLIVSDIAMPGLNGFGLLKAVADSAKYKHIPFIVISAHDEQEPCMEALRLGANDYITKPFNLEQVSLKVRNLLERSTIESAPTARPALHPQNSCSPKNSNERFMLKYEKILNRHYADPNFTIELCAKYMTISERQLQRRIKDIYALTPIAHLKHFRLLKSRQMLLQGFSISYAYQAVGLSSQSHFSRAFKTAFGITPKQVKSILSDC